MCRFAACSVHYSVPDADIVCSYGATCVHMCVVCSLFAAIDGMSMSQCVLNCTADAAGLLVVMVVPTNIAIVIHLQGGDVDGEARR
jgi:hypothetical protein